MSRKRTFEVRSLGGWSTEIRARTPRRAAERAADKAWNHWAWECSDGFTLEVFVDEEWRQYEIDVDFEPIFHASKVKRDDNE